MTPAEYKREWVKKNPEKMKILRARHYPKSLAQKNSHYNANKEQILLDCKEKYANDEAYREYRKSKTKEYYHSSGGNLKQKQKAHDARLLVIDGYGGCCTCCGESRTNFLTVEHVNNDGNLDRKKNVVGIRLYNMIIKAGFPPEFSILCYNCNCSKGVYGMCPHQEERETLNVAKGIILNQNVLQPCGQTSNNPS